MQGPTVQDVRARDSSGLSSAKKTLWGLSGSVFLPFDLPLAF
jgi:hypothetical protein